MAGKGRRPDGGETSLWQKMMQGVNPWHKDTGLTQDAPDTMAKKREKPVVDAPQLSRKIQAAPGPLMPSAPKILDRKTEQKLVRGKMPIEAILDLHGMTQDMAHRHLDRFITQSYHAGKRCVLVITGKGSLDHQGDVLVSERRERGVLKARLPDWLAMTPLSDVVLKHTPATSKHGGGGAFYIYLKNNTK